MLRGDTNVFKFSFLYTPLFLQKFVANVFCDIFCGVWRVTSRSAPFFFSLNAYHLVIFNTSTSDPVIYKPRQKLDFSYKESKMGQIIFFQSDQCFFSDNSIHYTFFAFA